MRILIIGLNFAPEPIGVGKYTGEMAAWFASRGHEVQVVSSPPYYPWWSRREGYRRWLWKSETWRGCRIIRCPLYVPRRPSGWRRILHLITFAATAAPVAIALAIQHKPDIVCAVMPTLLSAPIALVSARLVQALTWLHVQDLELDAGRQLNVIARNSVTKAAERIERTVFRRFDIVSAISPKILAEIGRRGVKAERLALFTNWVNSDVIYQLKSSARLRTALGISTERCVALYSGSMGEKQGLETVVAAARKLAKNKSSPLFILAGEGHARHRIEIEARELSNVVLLPVQPEEQFNEFLNLGDIHLLPQRAEVADLVLPSKLCAILAVGKPVIATVARDTQLAQIIGDAGIIVPPGDAGALITAIQTLALDPSRRRQMGEAAMKIAREMFDRETVLTRMETRLLDESRAGSSPRKTTYISQA